MLLSPIIEIIRNMNWKNVLVKIKNGVITVIYHRSSPLARYINKIVNGYKLQIKDEKYVMILYRINNKERPHGFS